MYYPYNSYNNPYSRPQQHSHTLHVVANKVKKYEGFYVDIKFKNGEMYCNVHLDSVNTDSTSPDFGAIEITIYKNGNPPITLPYEIKDIDTLAQAGYLCYRNQEQPQHQSDLWNNSYNNPYNY